MDNLVCFKSCSSYKRQVICRATVDILCVLIVGAGVLAIQLGASPYKRGFFCDDESIKHPVLPDTISAQLDAAVGILLPVVIIIVVEFLCYRLHIRPYSGCSWPFTAYKVIIIFIFGAGVNQFLTDVGKYSIGRLRPHYLTLCNPDYSLLNCSQGYITDAVCRSTDADKLKEARLSFPSGHASFSMYTMMYAILYLQGRVQCKDFHLIRPVFQLVLFSMGFFTCLSRVSDYMHHWSDVLFGGLLGIAVSILMVRGLAFFGTNLCPNGVSCFNGSKQKTISDDSHHLCYASATQTLSPQSQEPKSSDAHVVNLND